MDIPRESAARRKRIIRIVGVAVLLAVVGLAWMGLARLQPAAPSVERASVWVDTVKRGSMLRQVRGLGTLVPEEVLWIPATTDGRVERRLALPGVQVKPDTVLVVLTNPELQQELVDSDWKLKAAEADLANLRVKLQSDRLKDEEGAATVESDMRKAQLTSERDAELQRLGLKADIEARISKASADDLVNQHSIEQKRLDIGLAAIKAQIDVQEATVEELRAMHDLKLSQVRALTVRAGVTGVLQEVPVEVGQRVTAGTNLARVVQPEKLKAELKIPETQAKDVALGLRAEVDTHNGIISGHVSRIDPAAKDGTVTVDVKLEGSLVPGARPDLSVEGTVELEKLNDVLYVGRPAQGEPESGTTLFKLDGDGKGAARVPVKLGRSSVNTVEVLGGLGPGDQVVLSDMNAWDKYDRIRLN